MLYAGGPVGSVDFTLGRIQAESLSDQLGVGVRRESDTATEYLFRIVR